MSANNVVTLSFNADTSQAKKEIQGLVNELNSLSTKKIATSFNQDIGQDVKEAAREVGKFSTILREATNIDTGKLDLSKLNKGLKEANTSLPKMAESFKALGSDGVKAFSDVVKQINAAEVPLKKTNALVDKLWTSMKNTVNWQISSSALHALMSGVQGAFRYAQDLNTSLNNIRIVTGASVEEMSAFAAEANKAAKALSTTTTAYTDASLIYFQQGLSKEEVKERADVTIKMANVTRQSATEVSNQLTAIWNNFDDGTKSLEYYADVLTKLGAATASSTDEIAGGLEKFAAVADTIGLSYEYAASALATITSNTRQSEEVVGTALKTIFARIQGLNLGETLDDGTTLNKYSEALQKVGISIFDSSGQLKKMDNILDEMGSKWQTLSKDQQVALAQTVAGVRQYNQLVSLMDNWNNGDSDSMSANLATAYGATGELQKQADVYAESWEAAQKRVQASAEALYESLIDDEFFINLLDGASKFLDFIKQAIDGLGGMKGLLATISTYILTIARTKFSDELKRLTGPSPKKQAEAAMQMKIDANTELSNMAKSGGASKESQVTAQTYGKVADIQKQLLSSADKMSDQQRSIISDQLQQYQILGQIVAEKAKIVDAGNKEIKVLERQLKIQERTLRAQQEADKKKKIETIESVQGTGNLLNREGQQFSEDDINKLNEARSAAGLGGLSEEQTRVLTTDNTKLSDADRASHMTKYQEILAQINTELETAKNKIASMSFKPLSESLNEYKTKSEQIGKTLQTLFPKGDQKVSSESFLEQFNQLDKETQDFVKSTIEANGTWEDFLKDLDDVGESSIAVERMADALSEARANASQQVADDTGLNAESVSATTMAIDDQIDSTLELTHSREQLDKAGKKIDDNMKDFPAKLPSWQEQVVAAASAVSSLTMAFTALGGIWDTLKDPDMSAWEKISSVFTTLASVIPALVMTWKTLSEAKIKDTIITALDTAATWANVDATRAEADANREATATQIAETVSDGADAIVDGATGGAKKLKGLGDAFKTLGDGAKAAGTKIKGGFTKVVDAGKGVLTKYGSTIGSVAAGVAVAAVIIAGAAVVFKALNDAYNKNEIAAQKAEAAAVNLADAYTEVKGKYEELKNTISSYQSARDGLDELTRGTAEFGDQISQANDEALKLLNTYGDLIGNRYSVDKDGLIKIDEEALNDIKQQELDKTQQAQSASVIANQKAREARLKADTTEMHRKKIKTDEGWTSEDTNTTGRGAAIGAGVGAGVGLAAGIGSAAAAGALAGSVVPVVGTIIGAVAGLVVAGIGTAIATGIANNSETKEEQDALDSLAKEYHLKGESALTDEKIKAAYGKNLNEEEIAAIRDLCKELNANTIATQAENEAMANQILADNEKVQNSRDAEDVGVFAGDAYAKATDEAMKKYMSDEYQAGFFGKGSDAQKDAWARYAEDQGLGDLKDYKVTDYRKDGGVEYSYTDESGKTQKKVISQDEWAAVVAAQDADAKVNEAGEKIVDILSKLQEGTVDILTGAKSGDMSGLTVGQLADTNNQELQKMSEADLQALGFEGTKEEILDQIAEQQKANIENIKLYAGEYGSAVSGLINNMIDTNDTTIQNVTQGTLKAYADTLNSLALHGGADVMTNFDAGLQGIMDKYSDKSEEIMSIANNIDWSSGEEALQEFNYQLLQIGINIDTNSAEWKTLVNAMQNINLSVVHTDLNKIRSKIADIKELTKDIEIGSIISDEDYDRLIKYNAELADMFMMTADGYKYIGAGDISTMADDYAKEQLQSTKDDNAKARAAHDAINNWGWSDGTTFTKEDWYGLANGTDSNERMNSMTNALLTNESEHIANMGYDTEYLKELSATLIDPNATEEQVNAAKAILQQFYSDVLTLNSNYENDVYDDTKAEEIYASTAASIDELEAMYKAKDIGAEAYDKQLNVLANQASSLEELQRIQAAGLSKDAGLDTYEYGQALLNLAEQYENCTEEAEEYSKALLTGDKATIQAAEDALEASIEIGEMAKAYDLNNEDLEDYAKRLKELHKNSNLSLKDASKLAAANMRLDRGVSNLNDNLEDYKKALKDSNRGSAEWSNTLSDLKTDLADILNIADGSMLSDAFAEATLNSEDLKKALDGDGEALLRLRLAAADNIIANLDVDDTALSKVQSHWDYLKANMAEGVKAGNIDQSELINSFNEMIKAGNMTKEQIEAALAGLNVSANVKTTYVEQETEVPTTITDERRQYLGSEDYIYGYKEDGTPLTARMPLYRKYTQTYSGTPVKVKGYVPQYSIEGTEGEGNITTAFTSLPTPSVSNSVTTTGKQDTGGGGGSTSTPSQGSTTRKSDTVERYKEVTDILGKVGREMQKLADAQDELWGKDRLNNIQDQIDMIDEETEALKRQRDEAETYMNEDATSVQQAASKLGLSFTIEDGYITDYEDVMDKVHQQLADAEAEYNSYYEQSLDPSLTDEQKNKLAEDQAAYEETVLQPLRDNIADLQDALGLYDESAQKFRDSEDAIEANERKKRELRYQKWSEQLELEIGFDEDDIELFEHLISVLGDNFYKMAEALAYMSGSLEQLQNGEFGGQMKGYLNQLETYNQRYKELESLKAQNKISDADYIAGLEEIKAGMMNNVAAIAEMDDAMVHYYGDTLEAAMDELSVYTDMIEHSNTVLDHYTNILEVLGKSTDYKKMGAILKGQASVAKNQADVSAAWYESRKKDAEEQARIYQQQKDLYDQGLISEEVLKGYEQKWLDAQTAANEAQDQMLSDAAAWGEALRAVVENELADLGQTLENELTKGYGSFDNMMTAMERASSLQEEYLTTTNQIYETNKMMRTTQQEIDKTTNSVAKRRLKQFMEETSALQNQTKLSQYELDIQQAKYDLLLAEIALEEAQQAKSTVRLQRDSEGNFGYVYTADQNQVAEAQQQLEDAQNKLYNIGLEGANDYSQKYAETMQEMYDTLTSIQEAWLNGEFETQAEYNQAMTDAQEYYYQKLQDYSSLYQVAITTDSRVVRDAWSTDFADMTYNTAQWKASVSTYITGVANAFQQWQTDVAGIESLVGKSLSEIETNVGNITTNSQALADTTVNSVIPALDNEITSVHNLTNEYLGLRKSILDVINEYNLMINTINGVPRSTYENQDDVDDGNSGGSGNEGNSGSGNAGTNGSDGGTAGSGNNGSDGGQTGKEDSGTDGKEDELTWDRIMEAYNHIVAGDWGNGVENRVKKGIAAGFTEAEVRAAQQYINYTFPTHLSGMGYSKAKAKELLGFDTGGYTGEWGPYGKLAVLHEKELVLNQQQTADLLNTMEFLDKILQTLDLQALSSQIGGILSSPYFGQSVGETLEQNVHIEASFPGVQDRNEIEEAFNTLINQASQYANRK